MKSQAAWADPAAVRTSAIAGVVTVPLHQVVDARGDLTSVLINDGAAPSLLQWNVVRSRAGVIRGVHVHPTYDEYYVSAYGSMFIFLKDSRWASPTFGRTVSCWLNEEQPTAVTVPAGVAHGVAFPTGGALLFGLSDVWTGEDEDGCRWNDTSLGVAWPIDDPILSARDANAGSYQDMLRRLNDLGNQPP